MSADLFLLMQDYLKKKKMLSEMRFAAGSNTLADRGHDFERYRREVDQARETFTLACRQG